MCHGCPLEELILKVSILKSNLHIISWKIIMPVSERSGNREVEHGHTPKSDFLGANSGSIIQELCDHGKILSSLLPKHLHLKKKRNIIPLDY